MRTKEEQKAYNKEYYQKNKKIIGDRSKKRRIEKKEEIEIWKKNYYDKDREIKRVVDWRKKNKDKYLKWLSKYDKNKRKEVHDSYIKKILKQEGWDSEMINKKIIEERKSILMSNRIIKQIKNYETN